MICKTCMRDCDLVRDKCIICTRQDAQDRLIEKMMQVIVDITRALDAITRKEKP